MTFYRRRLPHLYNKDQPLFITWRLHGSLPPGRAFPSCVPTSGKAFVCFDRLLDEARSGPLHLVRPNLADMVMEAILYNATTLGHYGLDAFVVMPNHVHLLVAPCIALPKLTRSLKGITAKRGNQLLGLTGQPFWQDESYDHLVRNDDERRRIRRYIEQNPVRAGLAQSPEDHRWSSAGRAAGGPPADQGVCPTLL